MKLQFAAHASVLVESHGARIVCDPWYDGKVFNNGWALLSRPHVPSWEDVDYIWISHEHPDHWNTTTLRQIPECHKLRIVVLYQRHASTRIADAIRAHGFPRVVELPLFRWRQLTAHVQVYCGSTGAMDSFLAIRDNDACILNLNDCVLNEHQLHYLRREIGPVSVLLTQFSFASWVGNDQDEMDGAQNAIQQVSTRITVLQPEVTVPFASFVYFCNQENVRMNAWANSPDKLSGLGLPRVEWMYPSDVWESTARTFQSERAVELYRRDYAHTKIDPTPAGVDIEKIEQAIQGWLKLLRKSLRNRLLLRSMSDLDFYVFDLGKVIKVYPASGDYTIVDASPDLAAAARYEMCSQVIWFFFAFPWGVDTIWISGMFRDRLFSTHGLSPIFRLARLEPRDVFNFNGLAQGRRTFRFWWDNRFQVLYRLTGGLATRRAGLQPFLNRLV